MQKWPHDKDKPAIFNVVTGDLLKALVRFRVIDIPGDDKPDLWKDQQVQQRYIDFLSMNSLKRRISAMQQGR